MTAYTRQLGDGGAIAPNSAGPMVHRIRVDTLKEAGLQGIASFGSADTLTVFEVPAGTFVHAIPINVLTAEGATLTADIGDADDADGWHDGVDLNAVARVRGLNAYTDASPGVTPTGYTNGKYYTADGVIKITFNNAGVDAAVFDLFVICSPCPSPEV